MQDSAHFQRLVDAAVQQAFDDARTDLTMRVMQAIAPALAPPDTTQRLAAAIRTIEMAYAQTDILGALLAACGGFATRCALFVARGVSAPLWQSSGFDGAALRGTTAQVANGLGADAMQSLSRAEGDPRQFDEHFVNVAGAPKSGKCVVLPLIVRDKVAALLYADAGQDGSCDGDALEILVRAAGNRIEIAATRKPPANALAAAAASTPVATLHAPTAHVTEHHAAHAVPVASAAPAMAPTPVSVPTAPATYRAPEPVHQAAPVQATAQSHPAPVPHQSQPQASQDDVNAKARRFAKLLVDEIKLYNQQEVTAGKQSGDLYTRLREPIDKSREAYEKRYASTAAASGNYFMNELVRILADNNIALMGPNFPR